MCTSQPWLKSSINVPGLGRMVVIYRLLGLMMLLSSSLPRFL